MAKGKSKTPSPLTREVLKDLNGTVFQVFFGQQPTPAEPGMPLAPTPQEVYEQGHAQTVEPPKGTGKTKEAEQTQEAGQKQATEQAQHTEQTQEAQQEQVKSPLAEIQAQVKQQAKASETSKGKEQSPEVER